ncbi:LOW QUALITY PROTEIN: hypothetical protein PHMEG_0008199, partial [Phytophthora megakarya]
MRLSAFVPTNTQKARTTAITAFERIAGDVSMEYVQASILLDTPGKRLAATMNRFGFYLATNESKKVKGGLIHKTLPCTKEDLQYLFSLCVYVHADYQDAALACLMWHFVGWSSDLGFIRMQHVPVSVDGAFYLRLLRIKTAAEQGLTLIPDKSNFLTCPLHALAVALASQVSTSVTLLYQLPELVTQDMETPDTGAPLLDILEAESGTLQVAVTSTNVSPPTDTELSASRANNRGRTSNVKWCQANVNRMLKRVAEPAGATTHLTYHSFRRGGAQYANGDDRLAAQWSFDRGAWDMMKTNKAFAYITNTAREDRKVARVLSGWGADELPSLTTPSSITPARKDSNSCKRSSTVPVLQHTLNVGTKALSILTAYLIRYYPQLKELAPTSPIVTRVEECLSAAHIMLADALAWAVALNNDAARKV